MKISNSKDVQDLYEVSKLTIELLDKNEHYKLSEKNLQKQIKAFQNRFFGREFKKTPKDNDQLSLFDMQSQSYLCWKNRRPNPLIDLL
tara:strand:+ start:325 stop:588 length:264 start_codon:yes stop_codon:yes gene_type:complete